MIELLAGEKHKGETSKAMQACNDYLRMGAGRSLRQLVSRYIELDQKSPPTKALSTLLRWSTDHSWQARAEIYDTEIEARKNAKAEAEMQSGLALAHERVRMLKSIATRLEEKLMTLKKVKGRDIELVDTGVVSQLRGCLDDIAKETGGRVSKQEITGKDGNPNKIIVEYVTAPTPETS